MRRLAIAVILSSSAIACGASPRVVRVYDGRTVVGAYVPPEAYAAYLRGVLAAESGDLRGAVAAFERAREEDDEDPEVFTRLGDARCRLDSRDTRADDAIGKALSIDPGYAPAFAARARCASARGRAAEAEAAARQAAANDPGRVAYQALVVRTASRPSPELRERAIALTVSHGEHAAAWEALVAWGRSHGDAELRARGLEGLVRLSPTRTPEVERGALELLGQGFTDHARRIAAAVADVPESRGGFGPRDRTLARLAIDAALVGGDVDAAERRSVRGHVATSEVAARAMLQGDRELATTMARDVVLADAGAAGAQMVLAALAAKPTSAAPATHEVPAACALVLADALASTSSAEVAREWLTHVAREPLSPRDPLVGPLAVDLAARGVLSPDDLPVELRIELAARTREAPPEIASLPAGAIDEKHALLHHVLTNPTGKEAKALKARLAAAADGDAVVGFAVSRMLLAAGASDLAPVRKAIAAAPANPLLLAVAVELAKRMGKPDELAPARARLMAVARTPAERALATE